MENQNFRYMLVNLWQWKIFTNMFILFCTSILNSFSENLKIADYKIQRDAMGLRTHLCGTWGTSDYKFS